MRRVECFAAAAVLVMCVPAMGQNALGDGRALDSNLREGSNGRNAPGRNLVREFQLRNAIVTGRAPGGLSFRGDVGYGDVDDFRAELAEDDLFAFERDSFQSALTGRGVRGAEALQLQMQLTVGGFVGQGEYLPDPVFRRYQDATSVRSLESSRGLGTPFGSRDPLEFQRGSLRSTSEFLASRAENPILLRVLPSENETTPTLFSVATPLRSISVQDEIRPSRRLSDLIDQMNKIDNRQTSGLLPADRETNRVEAEPTVHDRIVRRFLAGEGEGAGGEAPGVLDPGDGGTGAAAPEPAARVPGVEAPEPRLLGELREIREALMRPDAGAPEFGGSEIEDPDAVARIRQDLANKAEALFEGSVMTVETLMPPAADGVDLYAMHMTKGQEMLASGQWFAAEERFTSALGLRPGDPMAAVGRMHAQIGGGMFLSAGVNLQKLFRAHPELINVRYDGSLLPVGARLGEISALIEARLRGIDDFSRGSALVKAYLGFQTGDLDRVAAALDRVAEIDDEIGRDTDTLVVVLRAAWLGK